MLPLRGVKVLEIAGLAPAPFAGMVLADFGADVIRVDRVASGKDPRPGGLDTLARGKRSVAINLKSEEGKGVLKKLASSSDVLIEPFRPGVMERLGLGPSVLCDLNPRLVYARMTGFGQGGERGVERAAGHDINYLALSGVLSLLREQGRPPNPPVNLLGDFAGGGFLCAFGILLALMERSQSGVGQVVDAAMTDGSAYLSTFIWRACNYGGYASSLDEVGTNLLDGGAHFYRSYACKDGKHMSVGAIEPQFYAAMLDVLGLNASELPKQMDRRSWPAMTTRLARVFATKTRDEWAKAFDGTDACCFPVLELAEAEEHPHNASRGTFAACGDQEGSKVPAPAPKLSRTPGRSPSPSPIAGQHTASVLKGLGGYTSDDVARLVAGGHVATKVKSKL